MNAYHGLTIVTCKLLVEIQSAASRVPVRVDIREMVFLVQVNSTLKKIGFDSN